MGTLYKRYIPNLGSDLPDLDLVIGVSYITRWITNCKIKYLLYRNSIQKILARNSLNP